MKEQINILFDGRMISHKMTGVTRHLINLLNGLNQVAPNNKYTVILNSKDAFEYFGDKIDVVWAKSDFGSLASCLELPKIVSVLKPDIYHVPALSVCLPKVEVPTVITIHDMIKLHSEKNYLKVIYNKYRAKKVCKQAKKIVTV